MALLDVTNDSNDFVGMSISTNTAHFDSTRVPYAFELTDNINYPAKEQHPAPSSTVVWYHFRIRDTATVSGSAEDGHITTILDANGDFLARISMNNGFLGVQVSGNGTTFGAKVDSTITNTTTIQRLDLEVTVTGSDVTANLKIDESQVATATITNSATLGVGRFLSFTISDAMGNSSKIVISEVIIADTDTQGMRLNMRQPTTAGFHTDWTGAVADLADNDTATGMTTATATDRQSMNKDTYNGGSSINAVVLVGNVAAAAGAPTKAQMFLRKSSTDFDGTSVTLGTSRTRVQEIHLTDPDGGGAWTSADIGNTEIGVEAVA